MAGEFSGRGITALCLLPDFAWRNTVWAGGQAMVAKAEARMRKGGNMMLHQLLDKIWELDEKHILVPGF